LSCKGATFIQRGFDSGLFSRIWALKLTRHCRLPNTSKPLIRCVARSAHLGSIYLIGAGLAGGRATVSVRWVADNVATSREGHY
jgi:hypothetical protein